MRVLAILAGAMAIFFPLNMISCLNAQIADLIIFPIHSLQQGLHQERSIRSLVLLALYNVISLLNYSFSNR